MTQPTSTEPSTLTLYAWTEPRARLDGISAIRHLFNRLDGMYPIRWRSAFPSESAVAAWEQAWAEAFTDDSITPHDVAAGLRNCRRLYDWPPSLTEFLRACRPGLEEEAAFHEAVTGMIERERGNLGSWSHPAIYWAAVRIGRRDILASSYQSVKTRWSAALRDVMAEGQWHPVPEPRMALPAPGQTAITRQEAHRLLEQLNASDIWRAGRGHRDWIARILMRVEAGEHLALATVRKAQQAAAEMMGEPT